MNQSPEAATQIAASAKEQLTIVWQQITGDNSMVPIAPLYPQCLFSPPHRGRTTVTIWVAYTSDAAATQVKQHLLQQRWADIPISTPQFATPVPAQLHDGDNAIYAIKLQSPHFTDADTAETVQIVNSVSDKLDNLHLLWLGKLSHNGLITSRFSASQGRLPDIPPPPWDLNPSPGLVGLAVSGITVLTHSPTSPGAHIATTEGDVIRLHFRRIPNRAVLCNQPPPQPVMYPPPRPPPPPPPPVTPIVQPQVFQPSEPRQQPVVSPTITLLNHTIRPAPSPKAPTRPPTVTTLPALSVPKPGRQSRAPLQFHPSPMHDISNTQPFPIGTWVSRPSIKQPGGKEYGFVLAHISDRPRGAPKNTLPVTFTRVLWATSEYLDVPAEVWAGYSVAQRDSGLDTATRGKVWNKIKASFRSSLSSLGRCIHALTPYHWQQLGMDKPTNDVTPTPHHNASPAHASNTSLATNTTPTPMDTGQTTGVRRGRDQTIPASSRSHKFVRTSIPSDVLLSNNPFYIPQHPDDIPTLPATLPDTEDDYGADWDADDSDAADRYDNAMAVAMYEGGPMPTTHNSRRGNRRVPRAPL